MFEAMHSILPYVLLEVCLETSLPYSMGHGSYLENVRASVSLVIFEGSLTTRRKLCKQRLLLLSGGGQHAMSQEL